ncbi:MAG: hypothetical protein Q4F85_06730 [Prevotella sp.]|nr:hypothetical protein [Prevotella sp.]
MNNNISPMQSDFERIKKKTADGQEYWTSRELYMAMGYSTYQKVSRVISKAIEVAKSKGMDVNDHFNQTVATIRKIGIVQIEGEREVNRPQMLYNIDAII